MDETVIVDALEDLGAQGWLTHLINSGPKDRCRAWAHAIRSAHPGYDGLMYTGIAGRDCVALYAPPGDVFPTHPAFTKPLADPALDSYLANAAEQIGYGVRPDASSILFRVKG